MTIDSPYHEGELAIQQRAEATEMARINATAIDRTILAGALRFISQQPMVVIGSVDPQGRVWTSVLFGKPGFIRAPDDHTLDLDISQPRSCEGDPLWNNLVGNANVGLLVIELGSRRRIRINGHVQQISSDHILIDVERAFPNCPKHIQRRDWKLIEASEPDNGKTCRFGKRLNDTQRAVITNADTFFVASAHPRHGIDASHRGGHPGFVQIVNDQQLRIPDFAGNGMFNTLGNITSYPYAGLVFVDFERGRLLQLTGKARILWDMDDPQRETGGTGRYWQFDITGWHDFISPRHLSWERLDCSPHIPELQHDSNSEGLLSLKIDRIKKETDRIKSFRLSASDGGELPEFLSGAHLEVKVKLPDDSEAQRHYSLLNNPCDRSCYEIGVLRETEGRGGSLYLHQFVEEGDLLEVRLPKNKFPIEGSANHSILIAGGIGITPILSMMESLASQNKSFELHYSARRFSELAFRDRINQLAAASVNFYASKETNSRRLDLKKLLATPKPGIHIYVCGPHSMINAVRDIAAMQGWALSQIHLESFGAQFSIDDREIRVHLAKSNRSITVPADRSILDALLDADVVVSHDCKRGECRMCVTPVLNGEPDHRDISLSPEEKASSMCVCVSRALGQELELHL